MHDYTARLIHDDRIAQLTREADAFRLAARARAQAVGPTRALRLVGMLRRVARSGVYRLRLGGMAASTGDVPVIPAAK
jgi:hypothetical protein